MKKKINSNIVLGLGGKDLVVEGSRGASVSSSQKLTRQIRDSSNQLQKGPTAQQSWDMSLGLWESRIKKGKKMAVQQ